jgi:hypothetical protein
MIGSMAPSRLSSGDTCILEVPGSNLVQDTSVLTLFFVVFTADVPVQ